MQNQVSSQKSICIGSAAAMTEAFVNHPLWAIKLRQQAGDSFTLNPQILYRGFIPHVLTRIPTTSLQMFGSYYCRDNVFSHVQSPTYRSMLSSCVGGIIAATLQTPVELTMTYQQKYGQTFVFQIKNIINTRGILALNTGYTGTSIRLASYTSSFFVIQPLIAEKLTNYYNMWTGYAHILSSIVTGTLSTLVSNPADVTKTIQQKELPNMQLTISDAAKKIYAKDGWMGFFNGTLSRSGRVCSGIAIISKVNEIMQP